MEQKLDGHRMLIHVTDDGVRSANRRGELTTRDPRITAAFGGLSGEWIFDGEWMLDGTFWLFDLPYALGRIVPATLYEQRRTSLEAVYNTAFADTPEVRLLDIAKLAAEKRQLLQWCRDNNAEGVVLKKTNAPYRPGKRMDEMLKCKFFDTCDVIILEVGRQGKDSCGIALLDDHGKVVDVGAIKMTGHNLAKAKLGDVVEVKYLYLTNDRRLYGPATFLKFRDDKSPDECTLDQCRVVNKQVRTLPSTERQA